jgi:two-component system, OmpR family, response regulator
MGLGENGRQPNILVVDGDHYTRDLLRVSLTFVGYVVIVADTSELALDLVGDQTPDLVVMDVTLRDLDGFSLLQRLRSTGHAMPTIFLSARNSIHDRLTGLALGADDYISKPFSVDEVVLRVGAVLRRHADSGPARRRGQLCYADVVLDDQRHQVWRAGRLVELSPTEFALLRFLIANAGIVVSRARIIEQVWDRDFRGNMAVVDSYIRYLRRKIDDASPPLIQTVRGIGYTLR